MTVPPTGWQEAAECARGCLADARETLSCAAWGPFIDLLAVLVAREQQKLLLRELRREDEWR
jgi:hypothetical protein